MSGGAEPFLKSVEVDWSHVSDADRDPFTLPAVKELRKLELDPAGTFLVGDNGCGKSTLLEAIAVASGMNAEGGGRNFRFATRSTESALGSHLRLNRSRRRPVTDFFLRAETFTTSRPRSRRSGRAVTAMPASTSSLTASRSWRSR